MKTAKTVASPSEEYEEMAAERRLPRTLMKGTRGMQKAGKDYLPQEPAEPDEDYQNRLSRSTLFNGFKQTVLDMKGRVFAKPIALGDDFPEAFQGEGGMVENVDYAGTGLDNFAGGVFTDGLVDGLSYILVEMAQPIMAADGSPAVLSQAQAKAARRRPYFCALKADDLIGCQHEEIDGITTLTQIRVRETVTDVDPENPYEKKKIEQIRVYDRLGESNITWTSFRKRKEGDAEVWLPFEQGKVVGPKEIPLAVFYANRTGFMKASPPLDDLAEINKAHWQSSSDQRNILHVARVPILFAAGFQENDKLIVSASSFTRTTDPNASLQFVEHTGAAIESGRQDLNDLIFQMQTLGLQLIIPKPGGETATGAAIDSAKMHSPLQAMANNLKDAIEVAFQFAGQFAGMGDDAAGSLTVNTDFGVSMRDATDITALLSAVQAGLISRQTFWNELLRRGVLKEGFDPDEESDRIESDPPPMGTMTDNPPPKE